MLRWCNVCVPPGQLFWVSQTRRNSLWRGKQTIFCMGAPTIHGTFCGPRVDRAEARLLQLLRDVRRQAWGATAAVLLEVLRISAASADCNPRPGVFPPTAAIPH